MAWNVFSVVSMTYPPAAGAPPACPGSAVTWCFNASRSTAPARDTPGLNCRC